MGPLLLLLPGPRLLHDPLTAAAWGAFAGIGQLVRAVTIGLRYIVRGGREGRVYAKDLVTEGMYALCRNPMYVGNVLIASGVALASNSMTTLVIVIPLVAFACAAIVAAEEEILRGRFGAGFVRYCVDVTRWWLRRQRTLYRAHDPERDGVHHHRPVSCTNAQ